MKKDDGKQQELLYNFPNENTKRIVRSVWNKKGNHFNGIKYAFKELKGNQSPNVRAICMLRTCFQAVYIYLWYLIEF